MLSGETKNILIFKNIHEVFKAEKVLIELKSSYQIIPIPKHFSSECGMCIHLLSDNIQSITIRLELDGIYFQQVITD